MLKVSELPKERYNEWDLFADQTPSGSIYQTTKYLKILSSVTSSSFSILIAERDGKIVGGVPLYQRKERFCSVTSTRLLLYYNGFVFSDEIEPTTLFEHLIPELNKLSLDRVLFNTRGAPDIRQFQLSRWETFPSYTYIIDIESVDKLWSKIDKNQRRLIRRAEENEITVIRDGDFDSFYELHYQVHKRKGAPLYLKKELFKEYYNLLKKENLCSLFQAQLSTGEIASSQLVLHSKHPVTHIVCAGSNERHNSLGVTPYLRWHSFNQLAKLGYKKVDLTDASINDVSRFKKQLGADLVMNILVKRKDSIRYRAMVTSERIVAKILKLVR